MNNEAKLAARGLQGKEKYYYLKFEDLMPKNYHGYLFGVATVCVIPSLWKKGEATIYTRGVAFCSPRDQFNRRQGRNIALGRAIQAIESHLNSGRIGSKNPSYILVRIQHWICLSEWNAILTKYEKKIMKVKTLLPS